MHEYPFEEGWNDDTTLVAKQAQKHTLIVNVDEDIGTNKAVPFDTNAVATGKR